MAVYFSHLLKALYSLNCSIGFYRLYNDPIIQTVEGFMEHKEFSWCNTHMSLKYAISLEDNKRTSQFRFVRLLVLLLSYGW